MCGQDAKVNISLAIGGNNTFGLWEMMFLKHLACIGQVLRAVVLRNLSSYTK